MNDLAGADDSDEGFAEVDVSTDQHLRETAERAVRTRRGTIREFPDRYVDLAGYVQSYSTTTPAAVVASGVQDDLEQDSRIARATVTIGTPGPDNRVPFEIILEKPKGPPVTAKGSA